MKNFFSRYSFPLTVLLLFAAMASTYWIGIQPFLDRIVEKRDEIQRFNTARENRNRQISALAELRRQYDSIIADEGYLNILYTDDRIVDFIRTLESLAAETGVTVEITSKDGTGTIFEKKPEKDGEAENTTENEKDKKKGKKISLLDQLPYNRYLALTIRVNGSYDNIVRFLSKMETLPVALDLVGMAVQPADEETVTRSRLPDTGVNPFLLTPGAVPAEPAEETLTTSRPFLRIF